jgi:hypothetical protein
MSRVRVTTPETLKSQCGLLLLWTTNYWLPGHVDRSLSDRQVRSKRGTVRDNRLSYDKRSYRIHRIHGVCYVDKYASVTPRCGTQHARLDPNSKTSS